MNTSFSLHRWWLLVARHWAENGRRYLLFIPVISGLILLYLATDAISDKDNAMSDNTQSVTYFIGLLLGGSVFGYSLFQPLNSRRQAIQHIMLPASPAEKTSCLLFLGVPIFFIAFTLAFYLVDIPMVLLARSIGTPRQMEIINGVWQPGRPKQVLNIFSPRENSGFSPKMILIYLNLQAAIMFGTVHFKKYNLLKSISATIISFFIVILLLNKTVWSLPEGWSTPSNQILTWAHSIPNDWSTTELLTLPDWLHILIETLLYCIAPALWAITALRLKEKEI